MNTRLKREEITIFNYGGKEWQGFMDKIFKLNLKWLIGFGRQPNGQWEMR